MLDVLQKSKQEKATDQKARTFPHLDEAQLAAFAGEISAVGERTRSLLGNEEDERYLRRLKWSNFGFEAFGRGLIHFSFEPITYALGVILLSIHFNLEVTFAHNCGHGAFNRLKTKKGLEKYNTKDYSAHKLPASFNGWKFSHNTLHHSNPNIVGKDPDIGYEVFRVTELQGKPKWYHKIQMLTLAVFSAPMFLLLGFRTYMFAYQRESKGTFLGKKTDLRAHLNAMLQQLTKNRYFFYNVLLFPLIAGLWFFSAWHMLKVLTANLLAEAIRGFSYGSMFHMGHHTGTVKFYPIHTKPANKAEWFVLQAETSHSVMMTSPLKHVFGGLDLQIEHHLFPDLPTNKLHQIQPEIERICNQHGVQYSKASFWKSAVLCVKNYSYNATHEHAH